MKKTLFGTLLLMSFFIQAQDLNYGISLGGNIYNIHSESGLFNDRGTPKFGIYLGGYFDYGLKENMGIKTSLAYNQKTLLAGEYVDFSFLDISPSFKYSFGENYQTDFYMLFGPRYSILLSAKQNGIDVKDGFENGNFGLQVGIGKSIYEFLELELRIDYGFSKLFEFEGEDKKIFGGIIMVNLNLEKLLNK